MNVSCGCCGRLHVDSTELRFVGYQSLFDGSLARLANCACRSTIATQVLVDASLCHSCKRPIRGWDGDPKIVVERRDATCAIYCRGCAATLVTEDAAIISGRMARERVRRGLPAFVGRYREAV